MKRNKAVKRLLDEAVTAAQEYQINELSNDYRAGYVKGVKSLSSLIEISQLIATKMAAEERDKIMGSVLSGYAASLQILLDAAESIIPSEYEMEP